MNLLIIGGGGREHALAWKLSQSSLLDRVYACPGNPGIAELGTCVPLTDTDIDGFVRLAEEVSAGLTVVGPEGPLVNGIVDAFRARNLPIVGPPAAAALIEGSKAFAKEIMARAGVPTARHHTSHDAAEAARALDMFGFPLVIKADGLAAGKGVVVVEDRATALEALATLPPGLFIVEEFLSGEEVSFIVFVNGERVIPLAPTQDHKRVRDNDTGPNTGGMGAYCDRRILNRDQVEQILRLVIHPILETLRADGTPFTGFLYAGLMLTSEGPKVLEFNARLGDPETQALMMTMESDFAGTLLEGETPRWKPGAAVCVVLAASGYPGAVRTGDVITGIEDCGETVFHAGTRLTGRGVETAGGRVLGVTARGESLQQAIDKAYAAVAHIRFDDMHYRRDIGRKGLARW